MKGQSRFVSLLVIGLLAWPASGRSSGPSARFQRGIGVTATAWAEIEQGDAHRFVFPPFEDSSHTLRREELETLRRSGFDFIRLAIDPGPFLQLRGSQRDVVDRVLMDRVRMVLASGLSVVVDFHPSDLHPDYTAQTLTAGRDTPVFQSYLGLVERTASLLGSLHSTRVALELMNEPPVAAQAWQPMLDAAYAAARRGSRDLLLILEGGDEASPQALMQTKTAPFAGDRGVLYAFHYYEPYQFTHQGASWNPARYLVDVPYPAQAHPLQQSIDATAAGIAAAPLSQREKAAAERDARARLEQYRRSGFDAATIGSDFDRISSWARLQGLLPTQILLGEFGTHQTGPGGLRAAERAQWFHDVSAQAASHGFGWAVWVYRGSGGFALTPSETSNTIDSGIAHSLGLIRGERADAAPIEANPLAVTKQ